MKSAVKNPLDTPISYPMLMVDPCDGVVFLFTGEGVGVVVSSGTNTDPYFALGSSRRGLDMQSFQPFTGEVTLRN